MYQIFPTPCIYGALAGSVLSIPINFVWIVLLQWWASVHEHIYYVSIFTKCKYIIACHLCIFWYARWLHPKRNFMKVTSHSERFCFEQPFTKGIYWGTADYQSFEDPRVSSKFLVRFWPPTDDTRACCASWAAISFACADSCLWSSTVYAWSTRYCLIQSPIKKPAGIARPKTVNKHKTRIIACLLTSITIRENKWSVCRSFRFQ